MVVVKEMHVVKNQLFHRLGGIRLVLKHHSHEVHQGGMDLGCIILLHVVQLCKRRFRGRIRRGSMEWGAL